MEYVKFNGKEQIKFMRKIKPISGLTWDNLAKKHKISRRSLLFYLSNDVLLPNWLFHEFCKDYKINTLEYNVKLIEINNKENKIKIPKNSDNLAEFLGALNGDGHLDKETSEICIVSHKVLDRYYITKRMPYLFKILFSLYPSINIQNNLIKVRKYSKNLVTFLNKEYGVPIGKKLDLLSIPNFIFQRKSFQIAYLRGLFDTDGTFYGRRNNEPVLGYTSLNPKYLTSIKFLLNKNGFNFGISGKDLYLYKRAEIVRFFNEIKPKNEKHTLKYYIFRKNGKILKTNELLNYMMRRLYSG